MMISIKLFAVVAWHCLIALANTHDGHVKQITLAELSEKIKTEQFLMIFLNHQSTEFQKLLDAAHEAFHILQNEKEGFREFGIYYTIISKADDTFDTRTNYRIDKYPHVAFFKPNTPLVKYDGRLFAKQISYFLKRQTRAVVPRESAVLKDLEQLERLEKTNEVFLLYCGQENDELFTLYEKVARDKNYLYYHVFLEDFCTRLNIRRIGHEENIWVTERGQEHVNETYWNQFVLSKAVIFVRYKPNNLFEVIEHSPGLNEAELKKAIMRKSSSNFYTDFDKSFDQIYNSKYKYKYFMVFAPTNLTKEQEPCKTIYQLSEKLKLTQKDTIFGCMNRSQLPSYGLELWTHEAQQNTVFFWSYYDLFTQQEGKVSRPFRYKLDIDSPDEIEKFYNLVLAGKVRKFYIEENHPRKPDGRVVYLTRGTYRKWVEDNLEKTGVAIYSAFSFDGVGSDFMTGIRKLSEEHKDVLVIGLIDNSVNELAEIVDDDDETPKLKVWSKGEAFNSSHSFLHPGNYEVMRNNIASIIPEVGEVEVTKKDHDHDGHDHHHHHHHGHDHEHDHGNGHHHHDHDHDHHHHKHSHEHHDHDHHGHDHSHDGHSHDHHGHDHDHDHSGHSHHDHSHEGHSHHDHGHDHHSHSHHDHDHYGHDHHGHDHHDHSHAEQDL